MFSVGRNQNVLIDVNAGAGTLLYCDYGQTIDEVIQYLLGLLAGLRGDSVADLRVGCKNASVVADLRKATQPADRGGCCKRTEYVVIDICCEAGCP